MDTGAALRGTLNATAARSASLCMTAVNILRFYGGLRGKFWPSPRIEFEQPAFGPL